MPSKVLCAIGLICFLFSAPFVAKGQRFLSDYDSTLFVRDTLVETVRRLDNLHFSGYMQPQFQVAQREGIESYDGGDFRQHTRNRFMIRRARVKLDYILPGKDNGMPKALFTFQFEATERDLNVRDMFVKLYDPKKQNFSLTMGMFARPFGYEVNLSSSYRETPERGRMSQILMPSERDLGAMVSYEKAKPASRKLNIKFDIGAFNGQGKSGPAEFDSYKDLISRLTLKPYKLSRSLIFSGGLSFLNGGWRQDTRYRFEIRNQNGNTLFVVDSSLSNIGDKATRRYYGADAQLELKHAWGKTEWRAEYWRGTQPGTATTTENPGTLPDEPTYIRNFDGAFLYFLQNIINEKWEIMVKYDWYDPNTAVAGEQIGKAGTNLTPADIKYSTLGAGLTHYFSDNVKALAYYSMVRNERTALVDYMNDIPDNVFTLRVQYRF